MKLLRVLWEIVNPASLRRQRRRAAERWRRELDEDARRDR